MNLKGTLQLFKRAFSAFLKGTINLAKAKSARYPFLLLVFKRSNQNNFS